MSANQRPHVKTQLSCLWLVGCSSKMRQADISSSVKAPLYYTLGLTKSDDNNKYMTVLLLLYCLIVQVKSLSRTLSFKLITYSRLLITLFPKKHYFRPCHPLPPSLSLPNPTALPFLPLPSPPLPRSDSLNPAGCLEYYYYYY